MKISLLGTICAIALVSAPPLGGSEMDPESDPRVYAGRDRVLAVAIPVATVEGFEVDGRLDEASWAGAAVLSDFTQYAPVEGVRATQRTRVRVFLTDDAIHFGIEAMDTDPGGVRATLAERDNVARSDDYVRIVLDTFDDQRRAYAFTVNPLGVQQDGLWVEGTGRGFGDPIDHNPDFLWESEGLVHDEGWTVEVKIPFKSLRFPDAATQDWGLNILRRIQRSGYESSWAPITANVANKLTQSGRLEGLRDLDPGRVLEFNPVLTASRVGRYDDASGGLARERPEADFGMNVTYGLTSNLTLDATYNPDFSQVEADAGQIVVNERFARFLAEKRPFFLEGTEIFSMPRQLVYTRSIVNPVGGAKLTGKVGSFNVGYLGAVDEVQGGSDLAVNLLRIRRDLGASSTVGAVYTDRTRSGTDFNRVGGADARLVFAGRYTLSLLGALSWDGSPSNPAEGDGATRGSFLYGKLERSGRRITAEAEFEDSDASFRPESGFIRRTGMSRVKGEARVNFYGAPGALLEQIRPSAEMEGIWDRDAFWSGGGVQETDLRVGTTLSFRRNVSVNLSWSRASFDFSRDRYEGLFGGSGEAFHPDQTRFQGMNSFSIRSWFSSWERVRGSFGASWGAQPVFVSGLPVEEASGFRGDVGLTLLPAPSFQTEVGVRYQRLDRAADGTRYSDATIPRLRVQYQFSRSLFLRGVFEYASQVRGTPVDPATGEALQRCGDAGCTPLAPFDAHDIHLEGLLSYEPSPGTVFFLGYSRDMEDTDPFSFREVRPTVDGLFLKVSYRFRS